MGERYRSVREIKELAYEVVRGLTTITEVLPIFEIPTGNFCMICQNLTENGDAYLRQEVPEAVNTYLLFQRCAQATKTRRLEV